ncbi:MAG: serine/threonine-protein kinase [Kiritimatiellia bacterium]
MKKDTHKPVLRVVSPEKTVSGDALENRKTGLDLTTVPKRRCPLCSEFVPFGDAPPLSSFECPHCGAQLMVPGKVDNFILHAHLGEGEMGTIYRANDESLDREVAVKVVRGCLADDPAQRERLRKEARAAGRLNHPNVAQVYALNFSNGHPYLVMELVSGLDFNAKLKRYGPLKEEEALRMALDISDGLSALHKEGLVHGDIKPANIVLDRDGNAKLVDFGLSGMMRHDGHGNLVGTPHYLAPEILRGKPDSHCTDIYSLGGTLYYLLCGRLPFDGETPEETLKARLKNDPLPLEEFAPHVSEKTCSIIMRMLETVPEKRYQNSESLVEDIRDALNNLNSTQPEPEPEPAPEDEPEPEQVVGPPPAKMKRPAATAVSSEAHVQTFKARKFLLPFLLFVVAVELTVAFKLRSFSETWHWMRDDLGEAVRNTAVSIRENKSRAKNVSVPVWESRTFGDYTKRGSTVQFGETLFLQSSGKGMWLGERNYRFFSYDCKGDYTFVAKMIELSQNNDYDIGGMLIKNQDVKNTAELLFGFLGSGHLFLQTRGKGRTAEVLKCRKDAAELPVYLKIRRVGRVYTAYTSSDGEKWEQFASHETDMHKSNVVGLTVSSQKPETIVSAKFSSVSLTMHPSVSAVSTNKTENVSGTTESVMR